MGKNNLRKITQRVGEINASKGWHDRFHRVTAGTWDDERDYLLAKLALVASEVSEAVEEARTFDYPFELAAFAAHDQKGKPVGFPSELADIIIRVLDLCYMLDIDITQVIHDKLDYNESRPLMHGKLA